MSIVVATADSPREIECALRLRYAVFTEEGGDVRYADHATGTYSDPHDVQRSTIVVARDGAVVVGALRLMFRADGPFIADALYRFSLILDKGANGAEPDPAGVALVDRVVVDQDCRGRGILPRMLDRARELARTAGCSSVVMAVAATNARMQRILARQGWHSYPVSDPASSWTGRHFYQHIGE